VRFFIALGRSVGRQCLCGWGSVANGNEGGRLSGGVDGPDFVEHGSDMVDSLRSLDMGRV
jgi:hypothetical protein